MKKVIIKKRKMKKGMNKIGLMIILFVVAIVMLLTSCKKDEPLVKYGNIVLYQQTAQYFMYSIDNGVEKRIGYLTNEQKFDFDCASGFMGIDVESLKEGKHTIEVMGGSCGTASGFKQAFNVDGGQCKLILIDCNTKGI